MHLFSFKHQSWITWKYTWYKNDPYKTIFKAIKTQTTESEKQVKWTNYWHLPCKGHLTGRFWAGGGRGGIARSSPVTFIFQKRLTFLLFVFTFIWTIADADIFNTLGQKINKTKQQKKWVQCSMKLCVQVLLYWLSVQNKNNCYWWHLKKRI